MLRAAGESYFLSFPDDTLAVVFKDICKVAHSFAERRNEIAHGLVGVLFKTHSKNQTYCLQPAWIDYKKNNKYSLPIFAYTSKDILYYANCFVELVKPVSHLAAQIVGLAQARRLAPS